MSNTPVVGSAFVEVHARASQNLEGEIRVETERAAQRVQSSLPSIASAGSQSVRRAEADHGAGSAEALAAAEAFEQRGLATSQRIAEQRAQATEDAEKKIRKSVKDTADTHEESARRTRAADTSSIASLLQGAAAYAVVDRAVRAVTATITTFLKAGDEGRLKSADDVRAYRELANGLDEMGTAWEDAKIRLGAFIATDINPFSTKFREGIVAIRNPLDTLSGFLGRTTDGTRDLARAFDEIENSDPSRTLAEIARRTKEVDDAVEDAQKKFDARSDATVRAVGAEYELGQASERLWNAQVRVNQANASGAEIAQRLADAERAIHEAREAAADAAQSALEKDRDLAEARRNLVETSFRTGSQSQDTKDAADKVQSAEQNAKRAHEEAGDAVADVAKAERDAADVRVKATEDQTKALEDLHDAQRDVAARSADLKAAQREATGETVTATDRLRIYADELDKFSTTGGPKVRTELEQIRTALANLTPLLAPWVTTDMDDFFAKRAVDAEKAYEARKAAGDPAPLNLGPDAGTGAVGAGATGGAGTITITNIYNTPVDPQQVARQQASQIGGSGGRARVI